MFAGKPWNEWIRQYGTSHQHPVNRLCHTFGIPLIAASLPLFVVGWALQFIGHAFEGKPPEFFHDWRFLFVGLRWWIAKVRGTPNGD